MLRRMLRPDGPRLVYRRTGEYDSASEVVVAPDGRFVVESGSFVTNGFREGRLSRRAHRELMRLVAALGPPGRSGFYDRATGVSELMVDGRLWMWPLYPPTPALEALVRFLNGL